MEDSVVIHKGVYWPKYDRGEVTTDGCPDDSACSIIMNHTIEEPYVVSNFVNNRRVVLQAGGNCGIFAREYAKLFENVYTFEPDPVLFHCLSRNISSRNVIKIQAALGNTREMVSTTNDISVNVGGTHISRGGNIPTLLIDDLNLPILDLLHLDIEGYEYNALRGGVNTIMRCKPVICLENGEGHASRYGNTLSDISMFLTSLGYSKITDVNISDSYNSVYAHSYQSSTLHTSSGSTTLSWQRHLQKILN